MISASSAWYSKNALQRSELLKKAAVEIAKKRGDLIGITVAELGKLPSEVDVEISEAIDFANYYAESILQIEEEGIEYLNKAIEMVPNHSFANWVLAVAYTDLEDYEKAMTCINIAFKNLVCFDVFFIVYSL